MDADEFRQALALAIEKGHVRVAIGSKEYIPTSVVLRTETVLDSSAIDGLDDAGAYKTLVIKVFKDKL